MDIAAAYDGPLQVIVGSKDNTVTPQPASGRVLIDYHDGEDKLDVFETGHVWGAFAGPEVLDNKMIPTMLEWLRAHM